MSDKNFDRDPRSAKRSKAENAAVSERRKNIGPNLNFAGAEAYKTLRTNLMLSLSADISCKVIGMTSALRGEGKSTTSINLAFTLAEASQRVLLIEADMRIPYMARTLNITEKPGLSNFLAGQVAFKDVVRSGVLCELLYVVPAGDVPPNPSELIASPMMEKTIEGLKQSFDYIIIDLPPIGAVSDGLAISRLLTGMVVVVRENYCDKRELGDAMRQLDYLKVKMLGFVVNASESRAKNYKKYGSNYGYYEKPSETMKKPVRRAREDAKATPRREPTAKKEPVAAAAPAAKPQSSSEPPANDQK